MTEKQRITQEAIDTFKATLMHEMSQIQMVEPEHQRVWRYAIRLVGNHNVTLVNE